MWRSGETPIQGKQETIIKWHLNMQHIRSVALDQEAITSSSKSIPEIEYTQYPNVGEASEECRVALVRGTKARGS